MPPRLAIWLFVLVRRRAGRGAPQAETIGAVRGLELKSPARFVPPAEAGRAARCRRRRCGSRGSSSASPTSTAAPRRPGSTAPGSSRGSTAGSGSACRTTRRRSTASGRPVSRWKLRPGDLVFFSGLGHVGCTSARNRMIHAPQSRRSVEVQSLSASTPPSSARRRSLGGRGSRQVAVCGRPTLAAGRGSAARRPRVETRSGELLARRRSCRARTLTARLARAGELQQPGRRGARQQSARVRVAASLPRRQLDRRTAVPLRRRAGCTRAELDALASSSECALFGRADRQGPSSSAPRRVRLAPSVPAPGCHAVAQRQRVVSSVRRDAQETRVNLGLAREMRRRRGRYARSARTHIAQGRPRGVSGTVDRRPTRSRRWASTSSCGERRCPRRRRCERLPRGGSADPPNRRHADERLLDEG